MSNAQSTQVTTACKRLAPNEACLAAALQEQAQKRCCGAFAVNGGPGVSGHSISQAGPCDWAGSQPGRPSFQPARGWRQHCLLVLRCGWGGSVGSAPASGSYLNYYSVAAQAGLHNEAGELSWFTQQSPAPPLQLGAPLARYTIVRGCCRPMQARAPRVHVARQRAGCGIAAQLQHAG